MAGRYRITGKVGDGSAAYEVREAENDAVVKTLTVAEFSAFVSIKDASGEVVVKKQVSFSDTSPMGMQRTLRRFLAEEQPGDEFEFTEAVGDETLMIISADLDEDEDDDDEYEDDDDGEYEDDD